MNQHYHHHYQTQQQQQKGGEQQLSKPEDTEMEEFWMIVWGLPFFNAGTKLTAKFNESR